MKFIRVLKSKENNSGVKVIDTDGNLELCAVTTNEAANKEFRNMAFWDKKDPKYFEHYFENPTYFFRKNGEPYAIIRKSLYGDDYDIVGSDILGEKWMNVEEFIPLLRKNNLMKFLDPSTYK